MRIRELLSEKAIDLNVSVSSKMEAIDYMTGLMNRAGNLYDREGYKQGVLAREEEGTTGIGEGIAIPHSRCAAVKRAGLAAMVIKGGVDYEALDDEPVELMFMIAAPEGGGNIHMDALARLSTMLMDTEFKNTLLKAKTTKEFLQIIENKEDELDGRKKAAALNVPKEGYRVLAITACPTGIAHTFMAAESLEAKGKELGIPVKVETQGADGAKNVLTSEEIKNAECIIIAADKNVDLARFDGKPVIITKVADGIHKAEELIQEAVSGKVSVYHHNGAAALEESTEKEGIGRKIYKDLMNGVSHMLPFVIGGGS